MYGRIFGSFLFLLALIFPGAGRAQQGDGEAGSQKIRAYQLFHQGKAKQSVALLRSLLPTQSISSEKALLLNDLLEICAAAYDWTCVQETIQDILPILKSEQALSFLNPPVILHEVQLMRWLGNDAYMEDMLRRGGAASVVNLTADPSAYAEISLQLALFHIRRNDLKTAELDISRAFLALLLIDPHKTYDVGKVLILLIEVLTEKQDISGAGDLQLVANDFLVRNLPPGSILQARYRRILGYLYSYGDLYEKAAALFLEAITLNERLDIDQAAKEYEIGTASDLAVVELVLVNKIQEAEAIHLKNPMQTQKDVLFQRGAFANYSEFYFGVTDVFLAVSARRQPDTKWKELFSRELNWRLSDLEQIEFHSYREFVLGLVAAATGSIDEGRRMVIHSVTERVNNFEKVLKVNQEGVQLPRLVDRIIITAGLTAATAIGDQASLDLMLRGGEILRRNLRSHFVDFGSLLASQGDPRWRRNIHSYIHLLDKKHEWELERIRRLLADDPAAKDKGKIINEYTQAISEIDRLKGRVASDINVRGDPGLSSVAELQKVLGPMQAIVSYFPTFLGMGRFCVNRDQALYSITQVTPDLLGHTQKLQEAVANEPRGKNGLDDFPFASAVALNSFLFGGMDRCLPPGTAVTVALPPALAGVPLGALLRNEPSRSGDGLDMNTAHWLIRDLSFSVVISVRHYFATTAASNKDVAPRPFLGIGNPTLEVVKLASSQAFQRSVKTRDGVLDFRELPETIDELKAAGKLFGAPASDILLGKLGTEEALRSKPLGDYDVLHFATHGLLKDDIDGLTDSALLLTPGSIDDKFDDGILSASEIARLSLNARLIVLSACNTAKYDLSHAGRGVQDLQAAFTIAGAPTLLGSLWPVDSPTARDMIIGFLEQWRSSERQGAAEALARATRFYLDRSDTYHQHPWFWAPYVIAGNGNAMGHEKASPARQRVELTFVQGFESGGAEIIHGAGMSGDILLAIIAEWDGKKMNGILSRHSLDGREKWRAASREIGNFRVVTDGSSVYAAGYTTEPDPIPVFRSFDRSGVPLWQIKLPELRAYSFTDLVLLPGGILTVGAPRLSQAAGTQATVLKLDRTGKLQLKSQIKLDAARTKNFHGIETLVAMWNDRIVVAINNGAAISPSPDRHFGMPVPCRAGFSTSLYELDKQRLRTVAVHSIADFRATALLYQDGQLFIGGEAPRSCSFKGTAAIFRLGRSGAPERFWNDDDLFHSWVKGLATTREGLMVAVQHERSLGLEQPAYKGMDYNKRWSEATGDQVEASLLALSKQGAVRDRQFLTAGLSVYAQGIATGETGPMVYGILGEVPWLALTQHRSLDQASHRTPVKKNGRSGHRWWQFWAN
jgi:CHAT domain-containing protein